METADLTQNPSLVRIAIGVLTALLLTPVALYLAALPALAVAMSVHEIEIKWWEQLLYWAWLAVVLGASFMTLRALYRWVRQGTPPPWSRRQPEPEHRTSGPTMGSTEELE